MAATPTDDDPTAVPVSYVRSELLYFIQNKCALLPLDSVVSICCDFYSNSEVEDARGIMVQQLAQLAPTKRVTKHNGADDAKRKKAIQDLVKLCLDPTLQLPTFFSVDMSRIPSVGVEHVDISMLLQEVCALRAEVRSMTAVRSEISAIRDTLDTVQAQPQGCSIPTVDTGSAAADTAPPTGSSFAVLAGELQHTGIQEKPKGSKTRWTVVGRATNTKVKTVVTTRAIDVFVSRLHPATHENEIHDCTTDILGTDSQDKIVVEKLQSKYEHLYSSFHICVSVSVFDFKSILDVLNSPDSWPEGALVRRYFKPKHG